METPSAAIVRHAAVVPDFLAIGHVTRDLLPDGGWRLGGTVAFAALTATRLGLRAAIVTSAPPDVLAAMDAVLPDIALSVVPSHEATTFENIYSSLGRQQFLRGRATSLTLDAVPPAWRDAPMVLLGPVAQEIGADIVTAFPHSLVAATPQGWLRQFDARGGVSPSRLAHAGTLLSQVRALILSREDVQPQPPSVAAGDPSQRADTADAVIGAWAQAVPLIAVTCGAEGAYLWEHGIRSDVYAGYPAHEVDPTGAGDVFATAFLCALREIGNAASAVDFANRVAACSVEAPGGEGIPTREMLAARWNIPG
ncbi:MAG TPA: PfkB family carbohydrate kinase [Ktedonobacterales bacterium]|nr:PfkB family carbohydrate kinase [Ktedonobacterales bacterium]